MRQKLSHLMMLLITIASTCGVASSDDIARQGFTVVVPPKALFTQKQSLSTRQVVVTATVDMWVQCDSVTPAGSPLATADSWGQLILCRHATTVEFPIPSVQSKTITVVTFAAF